MNISFRSRLTLYKCVVSPHFQRSWGIRNWSIVLHSVLLLLLITYFDYYFVCNFRKSLASVPNTLKNYRESIYSLHSVRHLKFLLRFANKRTCFFFISLTSPSGYKPLRIYARPDIGSSEYKPFRI